METLEFTVKLLSPAFIAGAMEKDVDGSIYQSNYRPDELPQYRIIDIDGDGLRIPSLRGIMRFWFRAMHSHLDVPELKDQEGELFGSQEHGQGIRIIPGKQSHWEKIVFGEKRKCSPAEIYLGYGPIAWDKYRKKASSYNPNLFREAIDAGAEFSFKAFGSKKQLEHLKRVLSVIHLFGGIGARSRRGWGALAVYPNFLPKIEEHEKINEWFNRSLGQIFSKGLSEKFPSFTGFYFHTAYRLFPGASHWKNVFNSFYQQFKKVRMGNRENPDETHWVVQEDIELEKTHLYETNQIDKVPIRMGYGFPYKIVFKGNGEIEYVAYRKENVNNNEEMIKINRRASPLILTLFLAPDNIIYGIALYLKSNFWGRKNVLIGTSKTEHLNDIEISNKAVEAYMND